MQPDISYLIKQTGILYPLMGFYDTPDPDPFSPYLKTSACMFSYFRRLLKGGHMVLTRESFGCGGAGKWLCDVQTRTDQEYVEFLADEEGLKANHELMRSWLNHAKPYHQEHNYLVLGPLKESEYEYLKTVSFFVNPDQLSMLMIGAQYYTSPDDPSPVISPFGSGCMQLVSLFEDLAIPQAIIGGTDMAMRRYLPADIMIFTVTRPMFELLCRLDSESYLERSFIQTLKKSRAGG